MIEELKRAVSMVDVVTHYGVDVPYYATGWTSILCPFHPDTNPSASINMDEDRFKCFVCDVSGDILDVVQQAENLEDVKTAMKWITENILFEDGQ